MISSSVQSDKDINYRNESSLSLPNNSMPNLSSKTLNLSKVIPKNTTSSKTNESKESSIRTHPASDSGVSNPINSYNKKANQDNSFEDFSKISQMMSHKQLNYYQIKDKSKILNL